MDIEKKRRIYFTEKKRYQMNSYDDDAPRCIERLKYRPIHRPKFDDDDNLTGWEVVMS